jgi:ABC-2 type transport system ATP-binding protein
MVGYIGANGAGKSTTIKIMAGILTPTSGRCVVDGIIPYENRKKNAQHIGVVFGQRTQLWWDLPLSETFLILKKIYNIPENEYNARMTFLSEVLALNNFINYPVRTLSLGQRMRADLASALVHNPKVLFLDEPTIGLDIVVKEKIREAIKFINQEYGTTIILTTHDLQDIEEICNRIIIIDRGKKVYDGYTKNIKEDYGYITTLEAIFSSKDEMALKNINFDFKLNNQDLNLNIEGNKIIIKFNAKKVVISQIISYLINKVEIKDLHIYEMGIEDIIKNMYKVGELHA